MSLNIRQRKLYKHAFDLWSMTRIIGAVTPGKPSGEVYALVQTNIPCIYSYTPNIDSEGVAGRLKEFTMLVLDKIYMEANVPIEDMSITVNVTILENGQKSNAWGQAHRVEGQPTIYDSVGKRKANNLYVECMSMEHPPPDIKAHYGL